MKNKKIIPAYDQKRSVLGKILPLDTPFNIIIDASEACNFKCQYCFRTSENKQLWGYAAANQIMEWDLFIKVVEQILSFPQPVRQISLSNHGEPLCNRKLPDMVRYIKKQEIESRVSIHTNASLLDENYIKDLVDSRIDKIVISLQGLSREKYEQVCGYKLDFEKFYANLKLLYNSRINTKIYIKIMDVALEEGEENKFYSMFSEIADRVYVEKMVPIWKEMDWNGAKIDECLAYNKYGDGFPPQKCCPLIFHTLVINSIGDVYPCTQLLSKDKLGNVKDNFLRDMWESSQRKELLRRQCKINSPEICQDCYIRQNSIYTKEDMIDDYREEILERLEKNNG